MKFIFDEFCEAFRGEEHREKRGIYSVICSDCAMVHKIADNLRSATKAVRACTAGDECNMRTMNISK